MQACSCIRLAAKTPSSPLTKHKLVAALPQLSVLHLSGRRAAGADHTVAARHGSWKKSSKSQWSMTKAHSRARAAGGEAFALERAFVIIDRCDLLDIFHEPCHAAAGGEALVPISVWLAARERQHGSVSIEFVGWAEQLAVRRAVRCGWRQWLCALALHPQNTRPSQAAHELTSPPWSTCGRCGVSWQPPIASSALHACHAKKCVTAESAGSSLLRIRQSV